MNASEKYYKFNLDIKRFSTKEILFQNNTIIIERSIDSQTNKTFIIHTLPLIGFKTSSLLNFSKILLKDPKNQFLLPFYGLISTTTEFKIVYEDPNVSLINISQLTNEQKIEVLKSISKAVAYLHSMNISHLRIKPTSIFTDSNNSSFYLGCIIPDPIIDLEKEDRYLPFYQQPFQTRDSFMFGLLIQELFSEDKKPQKDLLKQFWRFEPFPSNDLILDLGSKCLVSDYEKRPTFNDILNFFKEEKIEKKEKTEININEVSNQIHNTFFLLCLGQHYTLLQNNEMALQVYHSELLKNNAHALNNIGFLMSKEANPDLAKIATIFRQSADIGFAVSQRNYAFAARQGLGIDKNSQIQIEYLTKSAEQGYTESLFALYSCYFEVSDPKSIKYLRRAALKSYPFALQMYCAAIDKGIGYPNDLSQNFIKFAFDNHYPFGLNNTATKSDDINFSNKLWKEAAEKGLKQAQYNYAVSLMTGRGIEINFEEAAYWMKKSAEQGYSPSMFDYALMLREGKGVPKDEKKAEEICIKAGQIRLVSEIQANLLQKSYQEIQKKLKS